jgi:uncharacterized protein YutE (UPF0331/DUF86 family)
MTREVLARKLHRLRTYLDHLQPHSGKSAEELRGDPYTVERLLELLVQVAVDIVNHDLAERGVVPESYRAAFLEAGRLDLLPPELADSLAEAAGPRNILVHLYETIDYEIVADSVGSALHDFGEFLAIYSSRLDQRQP